MAPASQGLLGRIQTANDNTAHRFGPNTAEVTAFIEAAAQLTPWQWRQVMTVRRLVASVAREAASQAQSAAELQAAIRTSESQISEPLARAGEILFDALVKRTEDKQIAAWHAMSALVMRHEMPALKFAVHYAPFATYIPTAGSDLLDPRTRHFIAALHGLTPASCESLGRRWRMDPDASRALLQAATAHPRSPAEEAVAIVALAVVPVHLAGDAGWSAVRTLAHGGRVLGCFDELTPADVTHLWAPLEGSIPLASLEGHRESPTVERLRAALSGAIRTVKAPRQAARVAAPPARVPVPYGPNTSEVTAFIKVVAELTPIQWLRVLDRRKLVASVTREGSAEPAGVVRSILAAIEGTRELDTLTRCRAFVAVERAGYALETHGVSHEQMAATWAPFVSSIDIDELNGGGFAHRIASLGRHDWQRVAEAAPQTDEETVEPLVNVGTALIDFFGGRSDDEAVAAWHAVAALVRRHQLTPIKFAASYAPFASAIPVTTPRAVGAMVSRYVTAVGRLGAAQCVALAQPWEVPDALSSALSSAIADGSARAGEEAAALAAVVTVPMRMAGGHGWAAVKTAAFGGRVISVRAKLTPQQLEALWAPIQPAIPLASLAAPARTRR